MASDQALLIFAEKPDQIDGNTRVSHPSSGEGANKIYRELRKFTRDTALCLESDSFVYYHKQVNRYDIWYDKFFKKVLLEDNPISTAKKNSISSGALLFNAFNARFDNGYGKVVWVSTSGYKHNPQIIKEAYRQLDSYDCTIGPSTDGNIYLLGFKKYIPQQMKAIPWHTNEAFRKSILLLEGLGLTYFQLPYHHNLLTNQPAMCNIEASLEVFK